MRLADLALTLVSSKDGNLARKNGAYAAKNVMKDKENIGMRLQFLNKNDDNLQLLEAAKVCAHFRGVYKKSQLKSKAKSKRAGIVN